MQSTSLCQLTQQTPVGEKGIRSKKFLPWGKCLCRNNSGVNNKSCVCVRFIKRRQEASQKQSQPSVNFDTNSPTPQNCVHHSWCLTLLNCLSYKANSFSWVGKISHEKQKPTPSQTPVITSVANTILHYMSIPWLTALINRWKKIEQSEGEI